MPISWKKNYSAEIIIDKINECRSFNENGNAYFRGFESHDLVSTLHSMLNFPSVSEGLDHRELIWHAISKSKEKISKNNFIIEINSHLSSILSTELKNYQIFTSASIASSPISWKIDIDGNEIRFLKSDYKRIVKIKRETSISKATSSNNGIHKESCDYKKISIKTRAKNQNIAFTSSLRSIDIYRSVLCLLCNSGMEFFGQSWTPINKIRLGSIHTIHDENHDTDFKNLYFEPYYTHARPFVFKEPKKILARASKILQKISKCSYKTDITDSLVIYVRALDEANQTNAFIKLWSALERITTPNNADYSLLIKRTSFIWRDADFATETLKHLRDYRNKAVHSGHESSESKAFCYQLQSYYREIILFHVFSSGKFNSLEEANSFLDLPRSTKELKRNKFLLTKAIHFRADG